MKGALLLVLLAVVASQAAVIPEVKEDGNLERSAARTNFETGYKQPGDRLLYRTYLQRYPINNAVQYQDFNYRGASNTRINLVLALEVGQTQFGLAWIRSGGVGSNNVSLRVHSAAGRGYHYMIEVWGR